MFLRKVVAAIYDGEIETIPVCSLLHALKVN